MSKYADAHQSPKGSGDERPTAKQIVTDEDLVGKLSDKVFLVTGCKFTPLPRFRHILPEDEICQKDFFGRLHCFIY